MCSDKLTFRDISELSPRDRLQDNDKGKGPVYGLDIPIQRLEGLIRNLNGPSREEEEEPKMIRSYLADMVLEASSIVRPVQDTQNLSTKSTMSNPTLL